jgi:Rps23 Pro-64 3,4-dihydroxylase Tpa1-like proline 4-hydroxylase
MFKISENLNRDELKKSFEKDKNITIAPFLDEESADKMHEFFYYDMPEGWWSTSTLSGEDSKEYEKTSPLHLRRLKGNMELISQSCQKAQDSFVKGKFSYIFDRTQDDHHEGCECLECHFREFLKSPDMISLVNEITGSDIETSGEVFASRYKAGHFLSPHHDMNKGKVGFVYSLTKDWRPQWGGNLYILEDDYTTIKKTVLSTYNRLVMFDIPSQNGIPHFVSHVVNQVPYSRTSITGWFH